MNTEVISVFPETSLAEATRLLLVHGLTGMPVVDRDNSVLGILTEYDLINKDSAIHLPTLQKVLKGFAAHDHLETQPDVQKVLSLMVKDVMNSDPLLFQGEATIEEVIATFRAHHRVNPVPVVDKNKKVIGIVSRADVLKIFKRLPGTVGGTTGLFRKENDEVRMAHNAVDRAFQSLEKDYVLVDSLVEAGHKWLEEHQVFVRAVMEAVGMSRDFYQMLDTIAARICESSGWVLGEIWVPSEDKKRVQLF